MLCEEALRVVGQSEKGYALAQVGPIGVPVSFDVASAAILLLAPLVRHFLEKGRVDQPVEFVGVHRMDSIVEPTALSLKPPDRLLVLAALLGMACMKGVSHPVEDFFVEMKPPQHCSELLLQRFLAHVLAAAGCRVSTALIGISGAMVVDVPLLLDLADDGAAAGFALDQP